MPEGGSRTSGLRLWDLTLILTIYQLYCGCQLYW
jgi:hypothetical protein